MVRFPSENTHRDADGPALAYTEADLREAFKAGWQERNRTPGLKKVRKASLNNIILSAIGGGRYGDYVLVPADRKYSHSVWLRSAFRKARTAVRSGPAGYDRAAGVNQTSFQRTKP